MAELSGSLSAKTIVPVDRENNIYLGAFELASVAEAGGYISAATLEASSILAVLGVGIADAGAAGGAQASGTVLFNDAMTAADTITVDGVVYTFAADPTLAPYNVDIGASAAASAANFRDAINRGATAGTDYHEDVAPHPTVSASLDTATVTLTARNKGALGNAITLAASDEVTSNTISGATLTGGADSAGGAARAFKNSQTASATEDDAGDLFVDHAGGAAATIFVSILFNKVNG